MFNKKALICSFDENCHPCQNIQCLAPYKLLYVNVFVSRPARPNFTWSSISAPSSAKSEESRILNDRPQMKPVWPLLVKATCPKLADFSTTTRYSEQWRTSHNMDEVATQKYHPLWSTFQRTSHIQNLPRVIRPFAFSDSEYDNQRGWTPSQDYGIRYWDGLVEQFAIITYKVGIYAIDIALTIDNLGQFGQFGRAFTVLIVPSSTEYANRWEMAEKPT